MAYRLAIESHEGPESPSCQMRLIQLQVHGPITQRSVGQSSKLLDLNKVISLDHQSAENLRDTLKKTIHSAAINGYYSKTVVGM